MPPNWAKIPNVWELRKKLNYGDSKEGRCKIFQEHCRLFIKQFISESGTAGSELHDRHRHHDVIGMTELVDAFLDKDKFGCHYWPSDVEHPNHNGLNYRDHHRYIKKKVYELFFKINHQAYQNMRYKSKNGIHSIRDQNAAEGGTFGTAESHHGSSANDPIDLEWEWFEGPAFRFEATIPFVCKTDEGIKSENSGIGSSATDLSKISPSAGSCPAEQRDRPARATLAQTSDPYEVPDSPAQSHAPQGTECVGSPENQNQAKVQPSTKNDKKSLLVTIKPPKRKGAIGEDTKNLSKKQKVTGGVQRRSGCNGERLPTRQSARVKHLLHESLCFPTDISSEDTDAQSDEAGLESLSELVWPKPDTAPAQSQPVQEASPSHQPLMPTEAPTLSAQISSLASDSVLLSSPRQEPKETTAPSASSNPSFGTAQTESSAAGNAVSAEGVSAGTTVASLSEATTSRSNIQTIDQNFETQNAREYTNGSNFTAHDLSEQNGGASETLVAATGLAKRPQAAGRARTSPPPPDLGHHNYYMAKKHSFSTTQSVQGSVSDSGTPAEEKQAEVPSDIHQTAAAKNEVRLFVISRRPKKSRVIWTPHGTLEKKSLDQLKKEIPLSLSADFRGFKFSFLGPEERTVWEVRDGNDYEFQHMKLQISASIEEWKEETEGSGADMVFQLHIEELRGPATSNNEAV